MFEVIPKYQRYCVLVPDFVSEPHQNCHVFLPFRENTAQKGILSHDVSHLPRAALGGAQLVRLAGSRGSNHDCSRLHRAGSKTLVSPTTTLKSEHLIGAALHGGLWLTLRCRQSILDDVKISQCTGYGVE